MRHARAEDLELFAPLLEHVRTFDALTERKPGNFYRKSNAFLHFHIVGDDIFADVKIPGPDFDRRRVTTKAEQAKLVTAIRRALR